MSRKDCRNDPFVIEGRRQHPDEDQHTPAVFYGAGSHTLTSEQIGTRYVLVSIPTLVDPAIPGIGRPCIPCRTL